MFERFSETARLVVVGAQEQARLLNHNYIGTEHLLLGVLAIPESAAAQAIMASGVDLDAARASVKAIIGVGAASPEGHIPFTPRSKKVLELSLREALQLSHNSIRSEHLLLALLREGQGVAMHVLVRAGVDPDKLRAKVLRHLAEAPPEDVGETVGYSVRTVTTMPVRGEAIAVCSRCNAALGAPVRLVKTTAATGEGDSRDIVLVVCPNCGGTLGVLNG